MRRLLASLLERLLSRVPLPPTVEDAPGPIDPRMDPEALEAFGRTEIRFGTQRAADARAIREAASRQRW